MNKDDKYASYLGDGVYASFDGYQIWLEADGENHINRIAIDDSTLDSFLKYKDRLSLLLREGNKSL
jgi:hypothetical protein